MTAPVFAAVVAMLLGACSGGGAKPAKTGTGGVTGTAGSTGTGGATGTAGTAGAIGGTGGASGGTMGAGGAEADAGAAGATGAGDASAGDASAGDASAGCTPPCTTGTACVDGTCLPAPVELAAIPGCGAVHLVLTGGMIVWTERATGAVKRLSTATPGVTPTVVAMNQPLPGPITADGATVYWASEGDRTITKAALSGGAPAPFLTALAVVNGLLASGGILYYGAGASTYKVSGTGAAVPTTLMTFPACRTSGPGALGLDADYLYQTDFLREFLSREKLDGTQLANDPCAADPPTAPKIAAPETLTHTQGELLQDALTVLGGQIIWADGANINRRPVGGATQTSQTLAVSASANVITGFVVTGANIYLGEASPGASDPTGNAIELAPLEPGDAGETEAKVIAKGQHGASQFAADATSIYWATRTPPARVNGVDVASSATCTSDAYGVCCGAVCAANDCAIMKLAK
jgi:hypothetical protein